MSRPARQESGRVVVRLLHKMRAIEHALRCCAEGLCRPQDVAVVAYLASHMDNETGECIRKYKTVADGCGMARSSVGESLKRLRTAGVIEPAPRHGDSGAQLATAFRLGPIPDQAAREAAPPSEYRTPPVHISDTNCSSQRSCSFPGDQATRERNEDVDWHELAARLAKAGQYVKRWGHGAESLAVDDLERWRAEKGATAILGAIARARDKGLWGEVLSDFLEKTYPLGRARKPRDAIEGAAA